MKYFNKEYIRHREGEEKKAWLSHIFEMVNQIIGESGSWEWISVVKCWPRIHNAMGLISSILYKIDVGRMVLSGGHWQFQAVRAKNHATWFCG